MHWKVIKKNKFSSSFYAIYCAPYPTLPPPTSCSRPDSADFCCLLCLQPNNSLFFFPLVAAQQSPAVVVAVWEAGGRGRDAEEQGGHSVVRRGGQGRQAWWLPAVLPREHFQVVEMVAQSGINPWRLHPGYGIEKKTCMWLKKTTLQPFSLFPIVFRLGFYRTLYFSSSYDNVYMPLSLSGLFQGTRLQGFNFDLRQLLLC